MKTFHFDLGRRNIDDFDSGRSDIDDVWTWFIRVIEKCYLTYSSHACISPFITCLSRKIYKKNILSQNFISNHLIILENRSCRKNTMNYPLFWTFFILFLCLSKVSCSVWDDLSIDGTEADTGYPSCVIDYIYIRYYRVMFPGDPLRTKPNLPYNATYEEIHFYLLLVYIHLYPRFVNFGRIMRIRYQSVGCICAKKPHTWFCW